jgi:hypothetical protein
MAPFDFLNGLDSRGDATRQPSIVLVAKADVRCSRGSHQTVEVRYDSPSALGIVEYHEPAGVPLRVVSEDPHGTVRGSVVGSNDPDVGPSLSQKAIQLGLKIRFSLTGRQEDVDWGWVLKRRRLLRRGDRPAGDQT